MPLFCSTCRSLLLRRTRGGSVESYCPNCQGKPAAVTKEAPPRRAGGPAGLPPALARLFPYNEVREGQRDFLLDAHGAVAAGKHLLANAPTGIGKTVSSLVAALAVTRGTGKRVFFLTSKQSQHRIVVDTLAAIRAASGEPIVVADLIAKQDMCPRPEAKSLTGKGFAEFCRREQSTKACDWFKNALSSEQGVQLLRKKVLHVEQAVSQLDRLHLCPHQVTLDASATADVVVCDYNVLFSDMRAGIQDRMRIDLSKIVLVVDEAHNLPDRIRDHLTLEVSHRILDEADEEASRINAQAVTRLVAGIRKAFDALVLETAASDARASAVGGEAVVSREAWLEALTKELGRARTLLAPIDYEGLVRALAEASGDYEKAEKAPPRGLARLGQFLEMWRIERRGLARILAKDRLGEWALQYKLLDPAILAKPVFDQVYASILMSGTLHPCEAARDVLGLGADRALVGLYPSPFDRGNRLVLADSTVTTAYKERGPEMYQRIAEHLAEAASHVPGHVAAFFPSYALLESVRRHLDSDRPVVIEERGLDKAAKERLVEELRQARRAVLLLGVQGGSLSEGYDYEDNLLKCVAIVGLPLPPPTLESEALIAYYTAKFGAKGKDYAYTFPAMNRVLQAAGRLIRGPEDRGVVLLMDKRFTWSNYRACYPPEFDPRGVAEPAREVRAFFAGR